MYGLYTLKQHLIHMAAKNLSHVSQQKLLAELEAEEADRASQGKKDRGDFSYQMDGAC